MKVFLTVLLAQGVMRNLFAMNRDMKLSDLFIYLFYVAANIVGIVFVWTI